MDSSDEEAILLALACEESEMGEHRDKKRKWVHNICADRTLSGEYHTLFPHLVQDPAKFFKYFRMSHEKFRELLSYVKNGLTKQDTYFRQAIGPEQRLAVTLRFLSSGDSFSNIAFSYRLGESTVRRIVHETCEAIWTRLNPKVLPAPDTQMWRTIAQRFEDQWNFLNCVGALDGKHVVIEAPANSGSMYFNYKKTFSIVLMALVDADYRFVAIDVGAFGKNSDGGILANSTFGKTIYNGTLNLPNDQPLPGTEHPAVPYVIVGDEAFPLNKNIMRPYPGAHLHDDESKKMFNYRLSRARRVSENAFGILTQKFRIYQRRIKLKPEHVDKVVLATCCLHNYLRDDAMKDLEHVPSVPRNLPYLIVPRDNDNFGRNTVNAAIAIREIFKEYFNSPAGSVEWQEQMVRLGRRHV